ncbi:hypothetical protein BKA58DRAFT_344797 [Alternaria rosae]|uniref:uncharacterized protein n=1 Tax=Alternaria rosae TaxID=1187941 RepID=UPI001E8CC50C|nr:uncharacterized protein BKA58DRAFT_344797 [Alternaria rosae]KAH6864980.1 hypothetical protein BKA58DRAFT_344797 [Alternaria rosae]
MTDIRPRAEAELHATRTCYLSNDPVFFLVLIIAEYNFKEGVIYLQDGFAGSKVYRSMNCGRFIQCFDNESGEEVEVVRQGTEPVLFREDQSEIIFTTGKPSKSCEMPFITTALRPERKYRLCFKPTTPISHWPVSAVNTSTSLARSPDGSLSASELPTPATPTIPWNAANGNDMIVFETRSSRPKTPKVTVSLSAPSTYSLSSTSKKFTFTLAFSTDAAYPFTIHADRAWVKTLQSDVAILNATTRRKLEPYTEICRDHYEIERHEFIRFEKTYTEHRELDFRGRKMDRLKLEVGKEYILCHLGGSWWWTEDTVDEVMEYLASWSSAGLEVGTKVEFEGAGEVKFTVVG